MSNKKNLVFVIVLLIVVLALGLYFWSKERKTRELTEEERNELIRKELNSFVPDSTYSRKTSEEIRTELNSFQPTSTSNNPEEVRKQLENI